MPTLFELLKTITESCRFARKEINFLHSQLTPRRERLHSSELSQRRRCFRAHGRLCWHHFVFRNEAHRCSKFKCTWRSCQVNVPQHQSPNLTSTTTVSPEPQNGYIVAATIPSQKQSNVWTQTPRTHRCTLATQTRLINKPDRGTQTEQPNTGVKTADVGVQYESLVKSILVNRFEAPLVANPESSTFHDDIDRCPKYPSRRELDALARPRSFRGRRPYHRRYW